MIEPPPELPEKGKWAGLARHINALRASILSLVPRISENTLTTKTPHGTFRTSAPELQPGVASGDLFRGEWVDGSYSAGDVVRCTLNAEHDDGRQAGTYHALLDVSLGDLPPWVNTVTTASLTVILGGGGVNAINPSPSPGLGYQTAPIITITGDGAAAAAHAVLGPDGQIDHIVVDAPGAGYTHATATVPSPGTVKWEIFSEGNEEKKVWRSGNKRVFIDAGRDGGLPIISVMEDQRDGTVGSVIIDTNDIPVGAGNKQIKIREIQDCSTGILKHRLEVCSDVY